MSDSDEESLLGGKKKEKDQEREIPGLQADLRKQRLIDFTDNSTNIRIEGMVGNTNPA